VPVRLVLLLARRAGRRFRGFSLRNVLRSAQGPDNMECTLIDSDEIRLDTCKSRLPHALENGLFVTLRQCLD